MEPLDDDYELLGLPDGRVLRTHGMRGCWCGPCPIHTPTEHHMRSWRMEFRSYKHWLAERVCEHGYAHPDPDAVPYMIAMGRSDLLIHTCDDCCKEPA